MSSRSKSRSKSPAAATKKAGLDPMDYADEAIALVLCLGLAKLSNLDPTDPTSVTKLMLGGGQLPVIGQSAVLTLHTLNTCQGRGKKFWLTDLMECVAGVFAAGIALKLLNGGNLGDALMAGNKEADFIFVTLCWYLQNHSIGGVVPNLWDMVTSSPVGPALQKTASLATACFVSSLIIDAAGFTADAPAADSVAAPLEITDLVKATLVAGASSAIPQKPLNTPATATALTIAVLVSTNGFTSLPVVGATIGELTNTVQTAVPFIGSNIKDMYITLSIVSFFLGGILTQVGVPSEVFAPGAFVAGLVNKVLNLRAY